MRKYRTFCTFTAILALSTAGWSQATTKYITVDQFGYLPEARKTAVIRDPQEGFDAAESFLPGSEYSVVRAGTLERVYTAGISPWNNGNTDESSGDRAWHFDFSSVKQAGRYYILDEQNNLRSFEFVISPGAYNEVLRQAVRTFFYQRSGFAKEAEFAGEAWADGASHLGPLQDRNCRSFFDKDNPASERDVSGGWYDAGDYNKYTNWTANYVTGMMMAYLEKPDAWGDDYNIPESGNGLPDILDEAVWGIDHLLRMQEPGGAVLSIVGESHASPPSSASGPSYYGPPNSSATLNTSAAFAIGSTVYRSVGMDEYADTLLARALLAWDWAGEYPDSLFDNNNPAYGSEGLGAGRQEVDDYTRAMIRLEAACYLFEATGNTAFRDYFDAHYMECHLMQWNWAYPFESANQDVLLYYARLEDATASARDQIRNVYRNTLLNSPDNLPAYTSGRDPYMAYIKDYTWGSNAVRCSQGGMYYNLLSNGIEDSPDARDAALAILNYLHGVNPLGMVYLSNMYAFGAENCVNEFYHSWFTNGSAKWDRVGVSEWGPAPGYLTGGPNPGYDWDGCCPSGCGSSYNNALCTSESLSPPKGQPKQKSYKDFNTGWPIDSWSVTENSCGYQTAYIRLLSKFVTAYTDCNGDENGTAFIDSCGVCAGGTTGIVPVTDPDSCGAPEGNAGPAAPAALIYPNPNRGLLHIVGTSGSSARIRIHDIAGKLLIDREFNGTALIDTSSFKPGFYQVSVWRGLRLTRYKLVML